MREISSSRDDNVAGKSKDKNKEQMRGEKQNTGFSSRAKKGIGIAFAGMLLAGGLPSVASRPLKFESSGLVPRGEPLTEKHTIQPFQGLDVQKPKNVVQSELEVFSHPNGPTSSEDSWKFKPLLERFYKLLGFNGLMSSEDAWDQLPRLREAMEKYIKAKGEASKTSLQEDAQETSGGKTPPDLHSRKMTPGEKTSRSAIETPQRDVVQSERKRSEPLELNNKVLAPKEHRTVQKGSQDLLNNKEIIGDINNLLNNKEFGKDILLVLKNKQILKNLPSLCHRPEFQKFLGTLVKNQNAMDSLHSLYQDQKFVEDVSKLCQKPEIEESLRSLFNDQTLQRILAPIQKYSERQGIYGRKLLWNVEDTDNVDEYKKYGHDEQHGRNERYDHIDQYRYDERYGHDGQYGYNEPYGHDEQHRYNEPYGHDEQHRYNEPYGHDEQYGYSERYGHDGQHKNDIVDRYQRGYKDGDADGYQRGYKDGNTNGYKDGDADGYQRGYKDGNMDGYKDGFESGKLKGYGNGYKSGFSDGNMKGQEIGYKNGHNAGKQKGYGDGYKDGFEAGKLVYYSKEVHGYGRWNKYALSSQHPEIDRLINQEQWLESTHKTGRFSGKHVVLSTIMILSAAIFCTRRYCKKKSNYRSRPNYHEHNT
jgi:hypothetical protein